MKGLNNTAIMKNKISGKFMKNRFFYIMLLPIVVYFVVFNYYPLGLGVYSSFFETKLLGNKIFVGAENYQFVMNSFLYKQAFVNTLIVGFFSFIFQILWGLILALLLNEIRQKVLKSAVQTVTYIPYLLSWSVVGGIWIAVLSPTGLVNGFLKMLAEGRFRPIVFMAEPSFARMIMIFTGAWRNAGYYAVLFLAAIVSIDPSIYEAATIDGATRLQQIIKIIIPNISSTAKTVAVLGVMGIFRNFDQIYVMGNSSTYDKIRNLLLLIFQQGIQKFETGTATAAATWVLLLTLIVTVITRKLIKYDESFL